MRTKSLIACLVIALKSLVLLALEHEKSFLLSDVAAPVFDVQFYMNSVLITCNKDICQRDIETGALERTLRAHTKYISAFVVTDDHRMITAGWDDMIVVWNLTTGSVIKRIPLSSRDTAIARIAYQNDQLYTCGKDGIARHIDLKTFKVDKSIGEHIIVRYSCLDLQMQTYRIEVDENFMYLGMQGGSQQLVKCEISTFSFHSYLVGHTGTISAMALKQNLLFTSDKTGKTFSWNKDSGEIIRRYDGFNEEIRVLTPIGEYLYVGGYEGTMIKWNIESGDYIQITPNAHEASLMCLVIRNEEEFFTGAADDITIRWNRTTDTPKFIYPRSSQKMRAVAMWKNVVIGSGEDQTIRLFDKASDSALPFAILSDHTGAVNCLFVHNDLLFSGGSDSLIIQWNLTSLTLMMTLDGQGSTVTTLFYDNSFLYSAGLNAAAVKWNVAAGSISEVFFGHTSTISSLLVKDSFLITGSIDNSIKVWNKETSDVLRTISYTTSVNCLAYNGFLIFSGQVDSSIKARDYATLLALETYFGHQDAVYAICFDDSSILYSASADGSVKRWNMASRKISFSFEYRNESVSSIVAIRDLLCVGMVIGKINCFRIEDTIISNRLRFHSDAVTTMVSHDDFLYSSGGDGIISRFDPYDSVDAQVLIKDAQVPFYSLSVTEMFLGAIKGDQEIILSSTKNPLASLKSFTASTPMTCLTISGNFIIGGSRSGVIIAWDIETFKLSFELKQHTFQIKYLLASNDFLFSASQDNSIIQWSLAQKQLIRIMKRYSAASLGHLGPVNSLSLCYGTLFSAGSDLTCRRWSIATGRHEGVYFGHSKPLTSVLCYNGSVFTGSEDFSVFMYKPLLPQDQNPPSSSFSVSASSVQRKTKVIKGVVASGVGTLSPVTSAYVVISVVAATVIIGVVAFFYLKKNKSKVQVPVNSTGLSLETKYENTDLNTVINSVMGISKHAAYLLENSTLARVKKIAAGGGGEIFLAKFMDPALRKKNGENVIQKLVIITNNSAETAFFQEVGIMIMLSTFPNFCKIIGYTENPPSLILQYYPDGSLSDWIYKNRYSTRVAIKIMKEISSAINLMHSHYLAHCDLKPQNVLVKNDNGVPNCFLTDFGITQIISEKIVATKSFQVMNLRRLSVQYAAPEAFRNFRSKKYTSVDFKMYDIYSFSCVLFEVFARRVPWI